jgi:hypothetical protein
VADPYPGEHDTEGEKDAKRLPPPETASIQPAERAFGLDRRETSHCSLSLRVLPVTAGGSGLLVTGVHGREKAHHPTVRRRALEPFQS